MRARDWPEGWKRLIWLLRNTGPDESLEAGFLGQVIFSGENDIGGIGFRTSDEYKAVFKRNAEINKQRIERFMAKEGMMTRRELADRLEVSPHTVNNAYSKPVYGKAKDIFASIGIDLISFSESLEEATRAWQEKHKLGYIRGGLDYIREQQFDKILEV